jgi:hypothetical protein
MEDETNYVLLGQHLFFSDMDCDELSAFVDRVLSE